MAYPEDTNSIKKGSILTGTLQGLSFHKVLECDDTVLNIIIQPQPTLNQMVLCRFRRYAGLWTLTPKFQRAILPFFLMEKKKNQTNQIAISFVKEVLSDKEWGWQSIHFFFPLGIKLNTCHYVRWLGALYPSPTFSNLYPIRNPIHSKHLFSRRAWMGFCRECCMQNSIHGCSKCRWHLNNAGLGSWHSMQSKICV